MPADLVLPLAGGGHDLVGIPFNKPALTYEEQIALLESRGLLVEDRARARNALERISYYRLSGYWHPLRKADHSFEAGASFANTLTVYDFDRRLRLLVLDAVERVEVMLRSSITYALGHAHGVFAHESAANFRPVPHFDHGRWYATDFIQEVTRAREKFLEHFRAKYEGFPKIPVWMASEVMSFGTLSKMFKGMKSADQQTVIATWGVHQTVAESWLHTISYVRNVCAHHARLWNRELAIKPTLPRHDPSWQRVVNNRRVYCVLCVLRQLTRDHHSGDDWAQQAIALLHEMDGQPRWQNAMGIPLDWANHSFWQGVGGNGR